jgi:hypothetical protein
VIEEQVLDGINFQILILKLMIEETVVVNRLFFDVEDFLLMGVLKTGEGELGQDGGEG